MASTSAATSTAPSSPVLTFKVDKKTGALAVFLRIKGDTRLQHAMMVSHRDLPNDTASVMTREEAREVMQYFKVEMDGLLEGSPTGKTIRENAWQTWINSYNKWEAQTMKPSVKGKGVIGKGKRDEKKKAAHISAFFNPDLKATSKGLVEKVSTIGQHASADPLIQAAPTSSSDFSIQPAPPFSMQSASARPVPQRARTSVEVAPAAFPRSQIRAFFNPVTPAKLKMASNPPVEELSTIGQDAASDPFIQAGPTSSSNSTIKSVPALSLRSAIPNPVPQHARTTVEVAPVALPRSAAAKSVSFGHKDKIESRKRRKPSRSPSVELAAVPWTGKRRRIIRSITPTPVRPVAPPLASSPSAEESSISSEASPSTSSSDIPVTSSSDVSMPSTPVGVVHPRPSRNVPRPNYNIENLLERSFGCLNESTADADHNTTSASNHDVRLVADREAEEIDELDWDSQEEMSQVVSVRDVGNLITGGDEEEVDELESDSESVGNVAVSELPLLEADMDATQIAPRECDICPGTPGEDDHSFQSLV